MKKLIFGLLLAALLSLPMTAFAHGSPGINSYTPTTSIEQ